MKVARHNEFPDSWLSIKLGEVIDYGKTTKVEPGCIGPDAWVLELEDIEKDTSRLVQRLTFSERQSKSTKSAFSAGDVLYGKLRPYLNKVILADSDGVCTTEIVPIRGNAAVYGRYLFHWMRHPTFISYVNEVSHGVNMPRLGTDAGKNAPFVLAPMPEQKRIADKVDTVLARVDACRERLGLVPAILKRFRQSVIAAATSGRLTEDWRNQRDIALDSWVARNVAGLCETLFDGPFGSNLKSDDYTLTGVRVVRLENIGHLAFDASKATYISEEKYNGLVKHTIYPGDLLLSSFVDEEVRVCQFPDDLSTAAINKADCFCLRVDSQQCDSRFLLLRLACKSTYTELREQVHGATRPRINLKQLKKFVIQLPSMDEQLEIARRVDTLLAFVGRLEARLAIARAAADSLTPALLAKAFRGELVQQDPNDEPAAELLKRLAEQCSGAGKPMPAKRTRAVVRSSPSEVETSIVE
ncbi:restriction endonuclease subunit S [Paraburkholderia sp. BCC1885]|uniref:restriction endonuclease subunit S n=1 Tax=Paraburkholderia sp. BCC1885 TaxID=2562669 RepID=UPI0011839736|nr:restriction endonuclease subunit S [Paraburkholderia sp. BCC1885]